MILERAKMGKEVNSYFRLLNSYRLEERFVRDPDKKNYLHLQN